MEGMTKRNMVRFGKYQLADRSLNINGAGCLGFSFLLPWRAVFMQVCKRMRDRIFHRWVLVSVSVVWLFCKGGTTFAQLPQEVDSFLWRYLDSVPGVRSMQYRYEAAVRNARWLKQLPDPTAMADYFLLPMEMGMGHQRAMLSVVQSIPFPGYLGAQRQVALHSAEATRWEWQQERINTYVDAGKMWLDLYYLQKEEAIVREHLQLLESTLQTLRERLAGGLTTAEDFLRLQMQIEEYHTRLKVVVRHRKAVEGALRQVLALPEESPIPVVATLQVPETLPDTQKVIDSLLHWSALILRQQELVAMGRVQQRVARLEGLPSFLVGASYFLVDGGRDALAATMGVSLPLWRKKYKEKEAEARFNTLADTAEMEAIQRRLLARFELVWFGMGDAHSRLSLYERLVELATHTRQIMLAAYAGGREDFVEVLRIDRELLEYRLAYVKALTDLYKSFLELRELLGR